MGLDDIGTMAPDPVTRVCNNSPGSGIPAHPKSVKQASPVVMSPRESGDVSPVSSPIDKTFFVPGTPNADTDYEGEHPTTRRQQCEVSLLMASDKSHDETPRASFKDRRSCKTESSVPNIKKTLGRDDII